MLFRSNTEATYEASNAVKGAPVPPVETETRDANILVKVARDRECNLWMYCNNYQVEDDKARCYSFGLCSKSLPGMFSEGNCDQNVTLDSWAWRNSKITTSNYRSRGVNWADPELSGYTLHNSYQIPSLGVRYIRMNDVEPYNVGNLVQSSGEEGVYFEPRLVHWENSGNIFVPGQGNVQECNKFDNTMTKSCGLNKEGLCLGGECIYPITGGIENNMIRNRGKLRTSGELSCRGYPEENSPFDPWGIIETIEGVTPVSRSAYAYLVKNKALEICTTVNKEDSCDCSYKKVEYNNQFVYFPLGTERESQSICIGGSLETEGTPCVNSEQCGGGICANKKSVNEVRGWQGYCVEKNPKYKLYGEPEQNPCLTWWPVEVPPGAPDIWIIDKKAAYEGNDTKDRYMCIANQPLKLKPLPNLEFYFNAGNPVSAGEIDNAKNVEVESRTTTVDVFKYCDLGGDNDNCVDLGGAGANAFSINMVKSDKFFTSKQVVWEKGCVCETAYLTRGGCTKPYMQVDTLKCTQQMSDAGYCTTTPGGKIGEVYLVDEIDEEYVCFSTSTQEMTDAALAINNEEKYAAVGVAWVDGGSFPLTFGMVAGTTALITGIAGAIGGAVAASIAAAVAASVSSIFGWVAALGVVVDWMVQASQTITYHNYVSSAMVYNLPPNAHILKCFNDMDNKVFPVLRQGVIESLKKDNTRVYCPLSLDNNKVSEFQDRLTGVFTPATEPSFYNNGKIKKTDVVKIDLVLGKTYQELKKKGVVNFFGIGESPGWIVANGTDNPIATEQFFNNNIITFENKEITGCYLTEGVDCSPKEKNSTDKKSYDCENDLEDVCIKQSKLGVPLKDGNNREQLIRKSTYKKDGKTIWEVKVMANKGEGEEYDYFESKDKKKMFFYSETEDTFGLPTSPTKFEANSYETDFDGFGARIIWGSDDQLLGAQLDLHDNAGHTAGINFFFVIHFSDGSCTEFAKVSKNSRPPGASAQAAEIAIDAKPVTWRLIKGKTNMGDTLYPDQTYTVYNIPKDETASTRFATNSYTLNRSYFQGIKEPKLDMTGYFTFPDLTNPFLTTYYGGKTNEFGFYLDERERVRSPLISYENRNDIETEISFPRFGIYSLEDLKYGEMLKNMFVRVFPTSSVNEFKEPTKLTFKSPIDCASPERASSCDVNIKPPVIAAPIQLSPGSADCEAYKAAGGKPDCKTFALNTVVVNKSNCSDELLSGGNCTVSPNSDVALEFYAWADPAQMPVRRIMYQTKTEDPAIVLEARSIANRKPLCTHVGWCEYEPANYQYQIPCNKAEDCVFYDAKKKAGGKMTVQTSRCVTFVEGDNDPGSFGNKSGTDGTGCKNTPYEFHFTYTSTPSTSTPRVQVLDNWGWCSGRCTTNNPYGTRNYGCYADGAASDCVPENGNPASPMYPWIEYNGNVIVE